MFTGNKGFLPPSQVVIRLHGEKMSARARVSISNPFPEPLATSERISRDLAKAWGLHYSERRASGTG